MSWPCESVYRRRVESPKGPPTMPTYRVSYADGRLEHVEGDHVTVEGESHIVIRRTMLVIGKPREVVVRRIRAVDIIDVTDAGF